MSFENFCKLSLEDKKERTERAITLVAQYQSALNIFFTATIRNSYREAEIFNNCLALNGILRAYINLIFDSNLPTDHKYGKCKVTHAKLGDVCSDTFFLLEGLSDYPMSDSECNALFMCLHDIRTVQKRHKKHYFIEYDWPYIYSHPDRPIM